MSNLTKIGTLRSATDSPVNLELAFHPDAMLLLLSTKNNGSDCIAIAPDQMIGLRDVLNSLILDLNYKGV